MKILITLVLAQLCFSQIQAPESLSARPLDGKVYLKWKPVTSPNIKGYRIYRSTDNVNFNFLAFTTKPTFLDQKAENGKSFYYYVLGVDNNNIKGLHSDTVSAKPYKMNDEEFLDMVQEFTFRYFIDASNPENGMISDRITPQGPSSHCSIAAIGFGLTAFAVGVEHGWISREEAKDRVYKTLKWLWEGPQGKELSGTTGYKGWFYHFLDFNTGLRHNLNVELSTVDTQLLLSGILFCREYFDRDDEMENKIRALADSIYFRVDFAWATTPSGGITTVWYPQWGDNPSPNGWTGYNEMMGLYILALGSPTKPTTNPDAWKFYTKDYDSQWRPFMGYLFLNFPPLFGHQYTHVWVDFRGIQDEFMRSKGIDYFENSRRATYANRAYCIANPNKFKGYSALSWGLTASDDPWGYRAHGASGGPWDDNGTIAPTAPGGSIPFAPEICIPTLRYMYDSIHVGDNYLWGEYGFKDAYNLSQNWIASDYIGIDQGPILLMIENYRTGLIWKYMRKNPYIISGLKKAGFSGGWLDSTVNDIPLEKTKPFDFELGQNYPNPFNSKTNIPFKISVDSHVKIDIFDITGKRIDTALNSNLPKGIYSIAYNASEIPSGVYLYRIICSSETGGLIFSSSKKMSLLK
jgi:hypothetical protein